MWLLKFIVFVWLSGINPYRSERHVPQYLPWVGHPYHCPPMFEDFNLETACCSIQLIANGWIFSARNLRLNMQCYFLSSRSLNWLQMSPVLLRGGYRRIGWVNMTIITMSPVAGTLQSLYLKQRMCLKHVRTYRWSVTVCGRCYATVAQVLGNGMAWVVYPDIRILPACCYISSILQHHWLLK